MLADAGLTDLVADGNLLLAFVVALAAGVVSFASPCVLPLVPGFLGFVTGATERSLDEAPRSRVVGGTLLFGPVAGAEATGAGEAGLLAVADAASSAAFSSAACFFSSAAVSS